MDFCLSVSICEQSETIFGNFQIVCLNRASENTLFNSGVQPFVVDVVIKGVHCIGTLISPMHILTLATCFILREDYFDIEKNVMRNCGGSKKGWKNCPRWFRPNTDPRYKVFNFHAIDSLHFSEEATFPPFKSKLSRAYVEPLQICL